LVSQYFFVVWQGLVIGVHTATIFLRPKFLSLIPFVVASAALVEELEEEAACRLAALNMGPDFLNCEMVKNPSGRPL
jgi:hypothetical protein